MDDLFRKLSSGARFSQKSYRVEKRRDLKLQSNENKYTKEEKGDELDFFGSQTAAIEPVVVRKTVPIGKRPIFKTETEMHVFRKEQGIKVHGEDVPRPIRKFRDLCRPDYSVPEEIVETLSAAGLKKPTPVQTQATTVLLAGRDAFITAPTGSGKTLVFVLAILSRLLRSETRSGKIEAVIISPTRELAVQIRNEFRRFTPKLADKPVIGSVLLNKAVLNSWQSRPPKTFPSILITTPKRLVHGIEKKIIDLSLTRQLMLDEADKLLELGLMEQIDDILAACTYKDGPMQKALFSATIPTGVEELARSFMNEDPVRVTVGTLNGATKTIKQKLVYVGQEEGKLMAIRQMLAKGVEPPVIIFTETIDRAQELFRELVQHGINADIIHSSRSQTDRERVITQFRNGRIWFLITTELLARGLDFPAVSCVINYDFPLSTASYIHRIGRTGRAGKRGKAITFFTREDADALRIVANVMRQSGCEVPEWMLQLDRKKTKDILYNRKRKAREEDMIPQ